MKKADIERTVVESWTNLPGGMSLTLPRGTFGLKEPVTITKNRTAMEVMCDEWLELRKFLYQHQ